MRLIEGRTNPEIREDARSVFEVASFEDVSTFEEQIFPGIQDHN